MIDTFDFEAKGSGEVFFVADHHIDVLGDLAINFLRFFQTADGFPKRWTVVEIVRHDGAVLFRGFNRFNREVSGRRRECGENAAGVKPARTESAKNIFPIEIARF